MNHIVRYMNGELGCRALPTTQDDTYNDGDHDQFKQLDRWGDRRYAAANRERSFVDFLLGRNGY